MDRLPIIHSYTRADAIADGVLIDVTNEAREAGFKVPVALTTEVWNDCVTWTTEDSKRQVLQDEAGRLWDVLWMAFVAARRANGERISFQLYRVPRGGRGCLPRLTTLQLHIGPGDELEPVITILLPGQD
jgi:hypothetical protein